MAAKRRPPPSAVTAKGLRALSPPELERALVLCALEDKEEQK